MSFRMDPEIRRRLIDSNPHVLGPADALFSFLLQRNHPKTPEMLAVLQALLDDRAPKPGWAAHMAPPPEPEPKAKSG